MYLLPEAQNDFVWEGKFVVPRIHPQPWVSLETCHSEVVSVCTHLAASNRQLSFKREGLIKIGCARVVKRAFSLFGSFIWPEPGHVAFTGKGERDFHDWPKAVHLLARALLTSKKRSVWLARRMGDSSGIGKKPSTDCRSINLPRLSSWFIQRSIFLLF